MKKIYVTFGGKAYDKTTQRIVEDAPKFGVDEVLVYDDRWLIGTPFYEAYRWLWETEKDPEFGKQYGFGWCCWKAYVIWEACSQARPGDLVLYTDADTYPISDLTPIYDLCERERVVLFECQGCTNAQYTSPDCFAEVGVPYVRLHLDAILACGRFVMFKAGNAFAYTELVLAAWEYYSVKRACQRLVPRLKAVPEFTRHSNEQSVLSLLALRYGIPRHREPCQFGWPIDREYFSRRGLVADEYPQLFFQDGNHGDKSDLSGSRFRTVK